MFVVVHQHCQVVEPVLARAERRLPNRAFVRFAITDDDENALAAFHELCVQREADADRKTMTQAAGGGFDAGNAMIGMAAEDAVAFAKPPQLRLWDEAFLCEKHIESEAAVALAENAAVAA